MSSRRSTPYSPISPATATARSTSSSTPTACAEHCPCTGELNGDGEYYLGAFLVGAYQETLGDLHNLLGDTNVVTIRVKQDGDYDFVRELEGDTVSDVLSYVEYDPKDLFEKFRVWPRTPCAGSLTVQDRRRT